MRHPLLNVLFFSALLLGLQGCETPSSKPDTPEIELSQSGRHALTVHTLQTVTLPTLAHWQQKTQALAAVTQRQCQTTQPDLTQIQQAFQALYPVWYRAMLYDFGPLRDNLFFPRIHFVDSMRQRGKDYSDTVRRHFQQRLTDQTPLNAAYFSQLKFTQVGLPALEVLLYDPTFTDTLDQNPRTCQLLTGLADQQTELADTVLNRWQEGDDDRPAYLTQLKRNRLPDGETAISKLLFSLQDYLRYLNQRQINGHWDAQLSGLTQANLLAGLNEMERLLTADHSGYGLTDYLHKAGHSELAQALLANIEQARKTTRSLDREAMQPVYYALLKQLERPLPAALDVNLGMNFTDGD